MNDNADDTPAKLPAEHGLERVLAFAPEARSHSNPHDEALRRQRRHDWVTFAAVTALVAAVWWMVPLPA